MTMTGMDSPGNNGDWQSTTDQWIAGLERVVLEGHTDFVAYFPAGNDTISYDQAHARFRDAIGLPELPADPTSNLSEVVCDDTDPLFEGVPVVREIHVDTDGGFAGVMYLAGEIADSRQPSIGSIALGDSTS